MTEQNELELLLKEKAARDKYRKFYNMFPLEGEYARSKYQKHWNFLSAGKDHSQRAFIGGNRTGKTVTGAFELVCHATGEYPEGWEGKRFKEPINAWAASIRNSDTRDIIQRELLGNVFDIGTGMIPRDKLHGKPTPKSGVVGGYESIYVKHISGGVSTITLKSYEQGRDGFQGTKQQVIWLDEEPKDYSIFTECLTRTADKHNPGIIICTFTPLFALSDVVQSFLPEGRFPENGQHPDKPHVYVCRVEWEDVPHLDAKQMAEILSAYTDEEREARSKGYPAIGSGAVFPVYDDVFSVSTAEPRKFKSRVCAVDINWEASGVLFGYYDQFKDEFVVYKSIYLKKADLDAVLESIKGEGSDILCLISSATRGRKKEDGDNLTKLFHRANFRVLDVPDSLESSIAKTLQMLKAGKVKVLQSCKDFFTQYRLYRRTPDGRIEQQKDHLMNCFRYLCMHGTELSKCLTDEEDDEPPVFLNRNPVTGY